MLSKIDATYCRSTQQSNDRPPVFTRQPFTDALPARPLLAAKQMAWLAKVAVAGWLPFLLLLITWVSSAVPASAQTGSCNTPSFAAATNFGAGAQPISITTGDFNGDGTPDLAIANYLSRDVSVLLGNGAGGFSAATNFVTGTQPFSITTGDFNGDGKPDLATANNSSDNVSVLLGNGARSFATAASFGVGSRPFSIIISDFNGDGKTDIATTNGGSGNVSILLGNGTGGLTTAVNFGVGTDPASIISGDFSTLISHWQVVAES